MSKSSSAGKVNYLHHEDKDAETLAKFKIITGGNVDQFVSDMVKGKYDTYLKGNVKPTIVADGR